MIARWEGVPVVEWLEDGRMMKMVAPLVFIDSWGIRWEVREGTSVDGSSIPRALWPLTGSPFVGLHRWASVPHDLFCRIRTMPWIATHQMYYDAMIISGVSHGEAARKRWVLMRFGPRWPTPQKQMA
jgi:hypothetical protein